jgi:ParB-like chromosome segregation protein Spo0J
MSTDRKPHRYADIFPMLPEDELNALAADIKKNGLQEPIVIYNEFILDGRNRYAGCKIAEVVPKIKKFTGTDEEALQYVASHNLHRRHLTASQRAMIAAKIADMPVGKPVAEKTETTTETPAGTTQTTSDKPKPPAKKKTTISDAAKKLKVSPASVKKAKEVLKKSPAKAKEVEAGQKSLDQAHKEVQQETGKTTDKDIAIGLGNTAIATLGRIGKEFRKVIYERVKIWIDANIDL